MLSLEMNEDGSSKAMIQFLRLLGTDAINILHRVLTNRTEKFKFIKTRQKRS